MGDYLTEDQVLALRLQGVPVTGDTPKGCCARCRRGTKAHGTVSECGYMGKCRCHDHEKGTR